MLKHYKEEYDTTSNASVYAKAKKRVYENTGKISCSICPYHKGENNTSWKKRVSWKQFRKTQYK